MPGSLPPLYMIFFVIPFYLQSVLVHSANCVKTCIQWHVEECSVALLSTSMIWGSNPGNVHNSIRLRLVYLGKRVPWVTSASRNLLRTVYTENNYISSSDYTVSNERIISI
jgi:hypothetical protein